MLICNMKNLKEQVKSDTRMEKAVNFLLNEDLGKLTPGRIPIDGENVYVKVMDYETIPFEELKYEAHKKYIDIHYVISGKEAIWCVDTAKMEQTDSYNLEKDVFHGIAKNPEDLSKVVLSCGDLGIMYPTDAHAPKGIAGHSMIVHKIVVKVGLD